MITDHWSLITDQWSHGGPQCVSMCKYCPGVIFLTSCHMEDPAHIGSTEATSGRGKFTNVLPEHVAWETFSLIWQQMMRVLFGVPHQVWCFYWDFYLFFCLLLSILTIFYQSIINFDLTSPSLQCWLHLATHRIPLPRSSSDNNIYLIWFSSSKYQILHQP